MATGGSESPETKSLDQDICERLSTEICAVEGCTKTGSNYFKSCQHRFCDPHYKDRYKESEEQFVCHLPHESNYAQGDVGVNTLNTTGYQTMEAISSPPSQRRGIPDFPSTPPTPSPTPSNTQPDPMERPFTVIEPEEHRRSVNNQPYYEYKNPHTFPKILRENQSGNYQKGLSNVVYDPINRTILVTDSVHNCIKVYSEDCNYIDEFGGKGPNYGQFQKPWTMGILIRENKVRIVVACGGNDNEGRVFIFSSYPTIGQFEGELGKKGPRNAAADHDMCDNTTSRKVNFIAPTGIACTDSLILVCDCQYIKIYHFDDICTTHYERGVDGRARGVDGRAEPRTIIANEAHPHDHLWGVILYGENSLLVTNKNSMYKLTIDFNTVNEPMEDGSIRYIKLSAVDSLKIDVGDDPRGLDKDQHDYVIVTLKRSIKIFKPDYELYCEIKLHENTRIKDIHDVAVLPNGTVVVVGVNAGIALKFSTPVSFCYRDDP